MLPRDEAMLEAAERVLTAYGLSGSAVAPISGGLINLTLAVTNPILSAFLGVFIFEEHLKAHGLLQYAVVAVAVVVMLVGVIRLARSPFVAGDHDDLPGHPPITPAAP